MVKTKRGALRAQALWGTKNEGRKKKEGQWEKERKTDSGLLFQCFKCNVKGVGREWQIGQKINQFHLLSRGTEWKQGVVLITEMKNQNFMVQTASPRWYEQSNICLYLHWQKPGGVFRFTVKLTWTRNNRAGKEELLVFYFRKVIKGQCAQILWCRNRRFQTGH